jgi:hypothetical protein
MAVPRPAFAIQVAISALVAALALVAPSGARAAHAADDNFMSGLVACDYDTGMVHAEWSYTNFRGPATAIDASIVPNEWSSAIAADVPLGETVLARVSFPIDVGSVTLNVTIVGDGWSETHSSPADGSLCPKVQVDVSFAVQCDTSLVVTMRNKPHSVQNAEMTIVPVVPAGAALGPFTVPPGEERSVTVPPPTVYVGVFESSTPVAGNSGPRPTPCAAPPPPAGEGRGSSPGSAPAPAGLPVTTTATATLGPTTPTATAGTSTTTRSAPPTGRVTSVSAPSTTSTGPLPWVGGAAALAAVAAAFVALRIRRRHRSAPDTTATSPNDEA